MWRLLCGYRWQLVGSTVVILLGVAMGLIPPSLIRALIDRAIPQHDLRLVLWLGSGMLLFGTVVAQGLMADLRERLYRHVQSLGLDFFTWTRAGEIQTRFLFMVTLLRSSRSVLCRSLYSLHFALRPLPDE
jgi:ATP-binding cassette subfamily B protein